MTKRKKTKSSVPKVLMPHESIENRIFLIRNQKVMLDRDLAELYGVQTKALNQAVNRNGDRFPGEFTFRLNKLETKELVTFCDRFKTLKHSTVTPRAFTEHGVAMLATVLKSDKAVKISIHIVKTFIRLREFVESHKELASKLRKLEQKVGNQDKDITAIVELIKRLVSEPEKPKGKMGFHP